MEPLSESTYLNDPDSIFDDLDDYSSFFGLVNGNELNFNGEVELARQYCENEPTDFMDLYAVNRGDSTSSIGTYIENESKKSDDDQNHGSLSRNVLPSNISNISEGLSLSLNHFSSRKTISTDFQKEREPRMKYLLRFPRMWQEFVNSGNMAKLKLLFFDIFSEECIQLISISPPIVGREKIYNLQVSIQRHIPDFCVFFSNIVRSKKRLITMKGNSFGTLPYASSSTDKSVNAWNPFENSMSSAEMLDEHHKIQKQKYDMLKSQNKVIKFERRATWHMILSRDLKHIVKMMACDVKNDVY